MVKLCLGTANFGNEYGFNNKKIDKKNILKILHLASKNKLQEIDTSFEYYNSHQILKKLIKKKMNINSKIIFKENSNFDLIKKKITNFNNKSPSKIHSLLFHDQKEALQIKKINLLKKLRAEGIISKIGVSIYDLSTLRNVLKLWKPDIIQVPINPFNLDFVSYKFLQEIKKNNILIFARSIFLQGILLKRSNRFNKNKFKNDLDDWFKFCELKSVNPVKACLDFCKSIKEIDYLVTGVQDAKELEQIIKFLKQPIKINTSLIIRKRYQKIDLRKI